MLRRSDVSLALAIAVGLAFSALLTNRPHEARRLTLTPVVEAALTDSGSPGAGARDPDLTVVVFTDYQCPICKATDPALEHLLATDPHVRVIFKDWPIFGAASTAAARAALAADRQGKYLALHQALMGARVKLDDQQVRRLARASGVDLDTLDKDRSAAGKIDQQLRKHAFEAWSLGLEGTPAYLIGPFLYKGGLDQGRLDQIVRKARAAGPLVGSP